MSLMIGSATSSNELIPVPPGWKQVPAVSVHKHRSMNVLLCKWLRTGTSTFLVRTVSHAEMTSSYSAKATQLAEALRQATLLLAHEIYGAHASAAFVMKSIAVDLVRSSASAPSGCIDLKLQCSDIHVINGTLRSLKIRMSAYDDSKLIATGYGDLAVLTSRAYQRVRSNASVQSHHSIDLRPHHASVGCGHDRDVVLGAKTGDAWSLALDTRHAVLFDHPADHVPGMVLVEAARQAVQAVGAGVSISGFAAYFRSYVEFLPPAQVRCTKKEAGQFEVSIDQYGKEAAVFEVHTRPAS